MQVHDELLFEVSWIIFLSASRTTNIMV